VLTWEPAPGADSYQILRAEKADGPFRELGRSIEPQFRDNAFQWDRQYFYLVKSFARSQSGEVEGGASGTIAVEARDRFAPATPGGLRAVAGTASVELSWQHNSEPDVAGYRVWRDDSAVSLAPLTAELLRAANYTDSQVSPGRTYVYAISAVDQNGNESARSEAVSVTVPEAAAAP
jgi:fibronectin type 3 domain-containing protein